MKENKGVEWAVGIVGLLAGAALAFGFKTPESRLTAVEADVQVLKGQYNNLDGKLDTVINLLQRRGK